MDILLVLTVGAMCICCFFVGARVGQKVVKGEEVKLPSINPLEAYRVHQAKQEAQRQQDRIATIMENIERYDGTSNGQRDVPKG